MWWRKLFSNPIPSSTYCLMAVAAIAIFCSTPAVASGVAQRCFASGRSTLPIRIPRSRAANLLLREIPPAYPLLARLNYIRGQVRLLVTINCDGKVRQIHVLRGHPFLAMAALRAIRGWTYRPFMTRSGPAEFQTTVDVNFALIGRKIQDLPSEPEKFLARGVRPPEALTDLVPSGAKDLVFVQVLVSDKGHMVDSSLLSGTPAEFEKAQKTLALWRFKPARWGNFDVPWYAKVRVPLDARAIRSGEPKRIGQPSPGSVLVRGIVPKVQSSRKAD